MSNTHNDKNEVYNGRAKVLTKLFRYLFLLSIGTTLASMMVGEVFAQFVPDLYLPGVALDVICSFGYSVILLRMASVDKQYRTAGYCILIAGAIRLLASDVAEGASKLVLIVSIATSFVQFIGEFNEMTAHDTLMIETDFNLSEKWTLIRKCFMITFLVDRFSLIVVMLIPAVGAVISIVSTLVMIVISFVKIYLLYRSYKAFESV